MRVQAEIVFPNNIKALRVQKQLTQQQLGRLMDPPLSESTISKMESGERRLTNLQLVNLASILGCDPEEIPVVSGRDPSAGVLRWQEAQQEAVRRSVQSGAAATGYVLAQLRKKHGKTMQQVADAIGVALSVYHRIETASRMIQPEEIEAAAKFYDLEVERLIAMFERRARENRKQLDAGTPPEQLLPRAPRSLLKDDPKWGRLGALERYAIRRSIRYVGEPAATPSLPVYGQVEVDAKGKHRFTIERIGKAERMALENLLPSATNAFLVRNFSRRLEYLCRPGALAYVDPSRPVALGDLAFLIRRDGSADAAIVIGDGVGPVKLKMFQPDEAVDIDDRQVAEVLRIGMLIFP